jgi:hypothetical protein
LEQQEPQVQMELMVLLEFKEPLALLEHRAKPVTKVLQVRQEQMELMAQLAHRVFKEQLVSKDLLVVKAVLERQEQLALPELMAMDTVAYHQPILKQLAQDHLHSQST